MILDKKHGRNHEISRIYMLMVCRWKVASEINGDSVINKLGRYSYKHIKKNKDNNDHKAKQ